MSIIPVFIWLCFLVTWIASAAWSYHDAKKRRKPAVYVVLLVLFGAWPLGLLAWLIFRPEIYKNERGPFNLEDHRQQ
jgi:hypothetical protein